MQAADGILDKIKKRIEVFDKNYSRFRNDSFVTKMSQETGTYILPTDAKPMLDLYNQLYDLTEGHMTPLIGQALSDAGYDAHYSFSKKDMRRVPEWDDCLNYDFPKLTIKKPVLLDFGALGKGYLVDIIGELLEQNGCHQYVINAGGDILVAGQTVQAALEHPADTTQAVGVAEITNQALCGSAGNRRAWGTYTHIMDPMSLTSPKHIAAVWAVADQAMLADALTTALYFTSAEALHKRYTFEYALVNEHFGLEYSRGFPAEFFGGDV
jgi:thiamine biosynthesis lipoprotein